MKKKKLSPLPVFLMGGGAFWDCNPGKPHSLRNPTPNLFPFRMAVAILPLRSYALPHFKRFLACIHCDGIGSATLA